jgi:hypothetical protein
MKWINIAERVPELGERVLAFDEDTKEVVFATWDCNYEDSKDIHFWSIHDEPPPRVTYWMPIPTNP